MIEKENASSFYHGGPYGGPYQHSPFGMRVQPYSSSASEPVSVFSYLAVPTIVGLCQGFLHPTLFHIRFKCLGKTGVHIKGRLIGHR